MKRQEDIDFRNQISIDLDVELLSAPTPNPPTNGACAGHDVSMWFPYFDKEQATNETYKKSQQNSLRARRICSGCEKRIPCLAYGLQNEQFGIWGGYTERQRKSLRRKFGIQLARKEPIINIRGMNLKYDR
jgi:hypothetical protein